MCKSIFILLVGLAIVGLENLAIQWLNFWPNFKIGAVMGQKNFKGTASISNADG